MAIEQLIEEIKDFPQGFVEEMLEFISHFKQKHSLPQNMPSQKNENPDM
ncbi:MAG: hypothetical protein LBG57_07355 [Treponema sp.]|jgi:hypothetical protein|nr:hypothetical protein [Treponema sp.]